MYCEVSASLVISHIKHCGMMQYNWRTSSVKPVKTLWHHVLHMWYYRFWCEWELRCTIWLLTFPSFQPLPPNAGQMTKEEERKGLHERFVLAWQINPGYVTTHERNYMLERRIPSGVFSHRPIMFSLTEVKMCVVNIDNTMHHSYWDTSVYYMHLCHLTDCCATIF